VAKLLCEIFRSSVLAPLKFRPQKMRGMVPLTCLEPDNRDSIEARTDPLAMDGDPRSCF